MESWVLVIGALVVVVALVAWLSPQTLGLPGPKPPGAPSPARVSLIQPGPFKFSGFARAARLTDFAEAENVVAYLGRSDDVAGVQVQPLMNAIDAEYVEVTFRNHPPLHGIAMIQSFSAIKPTSGDPPSGLLLRALQNAMGGPAKTQPPMYDRTPEITAAGTVFRGDGFTDRATNRTVTMFFPAVYADWHFASEFPASRRPTGWFL